MQAFIIMALGVMLATFGAQEYKNHSMTTNQDTLQITSQNLASNFYIYNDLAVNYIIANYATFYNTNPTSSIFYNKNYGFDYTKIEPMKYYTYTPNFDFRSAPIELTFSSPNDNESSNLIPVMYLLTTFDKTINNSRASQLKDDELIANVFGSFNSILTDKNYKGDSTYWTNSIYGSIENCNVKFLLSKTTNAVEEQNITVQVKNICNQLQTQQFAMGKFFFLTPVYPNN